MDEEKSTDESPRVSMNPSPVTVSEEKMCANDDTITAKAATAEEKVEIVAISETVVLPQGDAVSETASETQKSLSSPSPPPSVETAENSKTVVDESKQSPKIVVAVDDAAKREEHYVDPHKDDNEPHETQMKTQNENENNNKNENDKINITSDETINKTVSSTDETTTSTTAKENDDAVEIHSNDIPSSDATETQSTTPSSSTATVEESAKDDDVKLEINSSSLLDRVILYSLKNTVVDNSRLDAVKNRYLSNASSTSNVASSSTPTTNRADSHQTSSSNSNKGSDNSSLQQQHSNNASKSVNEVIEEFKSGTRATTEWPVACSSTNNRTQSASDKSDNSRHDEPSTKGAEKVYIINDSNNEMTRETMMSRECDKNVIFISKGAERSSSYKSDFISENPPLPPHPSSHFSSLPTTTPPPPSHVKPETAHHSAYKFNFPAQQRHLNAYDNSYHANATNSSRQSLQERVVNENSFLKRDPTSQQQQQQQYRDEVKTVIKQTTSRAPCMRLPDFSKQNFDTSSLTSVKSRAASFENSSSFAAAIMEVHHQQQQNKTTTQPISTPPLTSLKMQPPDFAEVIRRNNYISDLQLKPTMSSEASAVATKCNYSHTPPPLHYNDSNYSTPSQYHYGNHHSRTHHQQQHIAPSSLSKMAPINAPHKTPTSSTYEPKPLPVDEPMAHIINKNHHMIAMKGEPSFHQQQHNLMRANEKGMKSIYSAPSHHQSLPPPLLQQPNVLNSHHSQTVSVIRESTTSQQQQQQQLENERRIRINNYTNELRNQAASSVEPAAHFYHGNNHHPSSSHSFSLKQKEDQLRQEGTIITLKTELNIVRNYDDRRSSTEVIREIHQSKPHESTSLDIRRTTSYHISHQGYHPYHGQENNYKHHDNDPRTNMLAPHPISTPPYYNNANATSPLPVSNERYPVAVSTVNHHPLRSSMNRFGNSNSELQLYEKQHRSKTTTSDEYQQQQQLQREFAPPPPPSSFRFASQAPPPSEPHHPTNDYRTLPESYQIPYPRPPPVLPVAVNSYPPPQPPPMSIVERKNSVLRVNKEVKFVPEQAASSDLLPCTSSTILPNVVIKKESPLDLSVKTVKTKADSTGCDQEKHTTEPKSLKIEFNPDFSRAATVAIAPVNFSIKPPQIPPHSSTYDSPTQELTKPVNGLLPPPHFPPSSSFSSFSQKQPHDKRQPLTFKEEMLAKIPYRKPFGRISLEEERKLDRMKVEQMLLGKAPPPLKHRYSQQPQMMQPKPLLEPRVVSMPKQPPIPIHHYQGHLMMPPTKEMLQRHIVNSDTRHEPISYAPPPPLSIPYHQNITVKTESEEGHVTSVITKQPIAMMTTTTVSNLTVSPTTSTHESVHRRAEESTILKLKSNLEQKKIMLSRNEVSEYQEQMQTTTTAATTLPSAANESSNNAADVSPRQFRTKGELKGFVQPIESINLLDWGNACHDFMQQLEVGGTATVACKKKRPHNKVKGASSDDEDKPLVKLFKDSPPAVVNEEPASIRQIREIKRIELEKKIAARLGHPSSSESESEMKKTSLRAKRRIRKLRKRETLGMKKTDGEQTFEEIESDVTKTVKHTKLDNLTSSEEDENGHQRSKECQERRSSRSSVSGRKKEPSEKSPAKSKSGEASRPPPTANDLKQLGVSSELDNLINEGETMTRSKRKLEIEKKLSNSKVLRNDKVVRNDLCVKKMKTSPNSKVAVVAAKKVDSPKRKLDDVDSKETTDKKKSKRNENQSTNESSDSENQKSDTEK